MKKIICLWFEIGFCLLFALAESTVIYNGHTGSVSTVVYNFISDSFFSAGTDGFIIEWKKTGEPERYQISALPVVKIAINPANSDIACYESDGFSMHKISVWDWKNKKKKYTKRYADAVLMLNYSAKGTWLMVSSAAIEGMSFFASNSGRQEYLLTDNPSNIVLAQTSNSESTLVTYSFDGYITYFDMKKGTEKGQFSTLPNIQQPILHKNNVYLSGVNGTDNAVVTVDMTTGDTVSSFVETDPHAPKSLYVYATITDNNAGFLEIFDIALRNRTVTEVISAGLIADDFADTITAIAASPVVFVAGTASGAIYHIVTTQKTIPPKDAKQDIEESHAENSSNENPILQDSLVAMPFDAFANTTQQLSLEKIAENTTVAIDDTIAIDNMLYFLSKGGLYLQQSPFDQPVFLQQFASEYDQLAYIDGSFIVWSRKSAMPVLLVAEDCSSQKTVFTPEMAVTSLDVDSGFLVVIENFQRVSVVDMMAASSIFSYSGAGLQDCIYIAADHFLYIAKTAASQPRSIFVRIDIRTGETVPATIPGNILYALCSNQSRTKLYGYIVIENSTGNQITELSEIELASFNVKRIAKYDAENVDAFLVFDKNRLYTDVSVNSISEINISNMKQIKQSILKRTSSMPESLVATDSFLIVQNRNGTISWFDRRKLKPLATMQCNTNGSWTIQ